MKKSQTSKPTKFSAEEYYADEAIAETRRLTDAITSHGFELAYCGNGVFRIYLRRRQLEQLLVFLEGKQARKRVKK